MGTEPNAELREFLRSRRAKITPDEAGLPSQPGSRRVPGLRREEVALLAGVSVDYYIRLERGRHANASESVLSAIAQALRLSELERAHLFRIARPARARPRPLPPQRVRPALRLLVDTLTDVPVLILGIYRAEPGSPSAERLSILAGWSAPAHQAERDRPQG